MVIALSREVENHYAAAELFGSTELESRAPAGKSGGTKRWKQQSGTMRSNATRGSLGCGQRWSAHAPAAREAA
eukprot:6425140-Pyramimonas_sp.AAC.3